MAGATVSEPRNDLFHLRESFSRVMLENRFQATPRHTNFRCNIHFNQLATRRGSQFQDALDATLQHNIHFKQLQDAVHATFQHPFQSTSRTLWMLRCNIHFNQLQDAVHATLEQPFQSTSQTLWMLRCNTHFNITSRVPRSYPTRLSVIFNSDGSDLSYDPKSPLNVPQSPLKVPCPQVLP